MQVVYIGLGSNMDSPCSQIQRAFEEIHQLPTTFVEQQSSLYQSKPWGGIEQADFINAVVKVQTQLSPQALMHALLNIELAHHRVRRERNGPRTLDCDLLLYGDEVVNEDDLLIPHPQMHNRIFVLLPLAEIAPRLRLPNGQFVEEALSPLNQDEIKKL